MLDRTWLRLNKPRVPSEPFQLEEGGIFKIGTTITYQCSAPEVREEKMEMEYEDSCMECGKEKRDMVFLPCRHNAFCWICGEKMSVCRLCLCGVTDRIKIYT